MSRTSQTAGDYSTQLHAAGNINIQMGISEERAREITERTAQEVIAKFAKESLDLIHDRITKLDNYVIAALSQQEKLSAFADPGFQRSYKRAQEGAAVSDKDSDYELLARLLLDRTTRGEKRTIRAGIERSIEIVDRIDDDALRGLTVFYALEQISPTKLNVDEGLDTMETVFHDIIDGPLPEGIEWMEHLDILDAVRINNFGRLLPFNEWYPQRLNYYLSPGVPIENLKIPVDSKGNPLDIGTLLIDHALRPGYKILIPHVEGKLISGGTKESTIKEIIQIAQNEYGLGQIHQELIEPFLEKVRSRPTLAKIETWWAQLPQSFTITAVGKVLAHSNSERLSVHEQIPAMP